MVELEDPGEYSDVVQEINARGWGVLALPSELVNVAIVREFYANAKPIEETSITKGYWVWGRRFPFDKNAINDYIKDHYVASLKRFNPFAIQATKVNMNYDEIAADICEAVKTYNFGRDKHLICL